MRVLILYQVYIIFKNTIGSLYYLFSLYSFSGWRREIYERIQEGSC